jgi:hypothetical protein
VAIAIGLLKTLLELEETKKSGAVDVAGPGARVRIFVEEGAIVYAADGGVGETLGRLLLREQVLTEEQYAAAIEWVVEKRGAGKDQKFGSVLVELGMLTPEQLVAALSAQVQRKVIRALRWTYSRVSFVEAFGLVDVDVRNLTPLEPLVLAALRLAEPPNVEELLAQARTRHPALRTDGLAGAHTLARLTAFRFGQSDDAFARGLDGTRSVDELLDPPEMRRTRAVVLASLLVTECLDLHARPRGQRAAWPPAPRSSRTMAALNVPPSSRRRPQSNRPAVHPQSTADREATQRLAARMKDARDAKKSLPPSASEIATADAVPSTARLLAERAFQAGKRFLRANEIAKAANELRDAAVTYPAPEYELWASWAEARRDPEKADLPKLREAAQQALAQDPECAFAYLALGHIALAEGKEDAAAPLLARARTLDPDAAAGLDVRLKGAPISRETRGDVRSLAPLLTSEPELPELPASDEWDVAEPGSTEVLSAVTQLRAISDVRAEPEPKVLPSAPQPTMVSVKEPDEQKAEPKKDPAPQAPPAPTGQRSGTAPSRVYEPKPALAVIAKSVPPASTRTPASAPEPKRSPLPPPPEPKRSPPPPPPEPKRSPLPPPLPPPKPKAPPPPTAAPEPIAKPTPAAAVSTQRSAAVDPPKRFSTGTALFVIASAALLTFAVVRGREDEPKRVATPEPVVGATPTQSQVATEPPPPPPPTPVEVASASPSSSAAEPAVPDAAVDAPFAVAADRSALDFPPGADGHRVYIDGRMVGQPPAPLVIPCGIHAIKVGSQGRTQNLLLRCGEHVRVPYP